MGFPSFAFRMIGPPPSLGRGGSGRAGEARGGEARGGSAARRMPGIVGPEAGPVRAGERAGTTGEPRVERGPRSVVVDPPADVVEVVAEMDEDVLVFVFADAVTPPPRPPV